MKVKELPFGRIVKIGTEKGSNFVYAGPVNEIPDKLNKELEETVEEAFEKAKNRIRVTKNPTKAALNDLHDKLDAVVGFLPLQEREIVEMEQSVAEPGAWRVIVKGTEDGKIWLVDNTEKPIGDIDNAGAEALVGAIYRGIVTDLVDSYVRAFQDDYQAKAHAVSLERYIMLSPYNAFRDPSCVISKAREMALDKLCYNGRLVIPRDKAEKKLTRMFEGCSTGKGEAV